MEGITITKREGRGRPKKQTEMVEPEIINLDSVKKLSKLMVDPRMMETMKCGNDMDQLFSYEGGLCRAANVIVGGMPGVGKTTLLLDCLARFVKHNLETKVLFISAEMGHRQMFKYLQRFPHFGVIDTLFGADYITNNMKDVTEQAFNQGYDIILIDSIKVLLTKVRGDMDWDKNEAEDWFVNLCIKQNKGENKLNKYTSFLGIQFLNISNGEFAGGGKLQYLFDSAYKFQKDKKTGETSIIADKNRDGIAGVPLGYELKNDKIIYKGLAKVEDVSDKDDDEDE